MTNEEIKELNTYVSGLYGRNDMDRLEAFKKIYELLENTDESGYGTQIHCLYNGAMNKIIKAMEVTNKVLLHESARK